MSTSLKYILLSSIIFVQTVSVQAATGLDLLSTEISVINDAITLDAAPTYATAPLIVQGDNTYTSWELIHRMPMLSGFEWGGDMAQFITPQMYIGTPFADNKQYMGQDNPFASYLTGDPTTYSECLSSESYLSFGLGERIENTDIRELKAIAKTCAQRFYGIYFDGTLHTTREEYIMMLMTMFGEDVGFDGQFTKNGKYIPAGNGVESGFDNVSATSWYSPYLAHADDLGILSTQETSWATAKMISDREAVDMLSLYTAYRMGYSGSTSLDRGMITTERAKYNIAFPSTTEVTIRVQ